jgi:DNA-binding YbaB/EbfC family protein
MNINQFLKQAQGMQKKMQDLKQQMASTDYTGKSGGGVVTIVMNGEGMLKKITIDESIIKADEKEILEDLIVAAFNDAKNKIESDSQNQISSALGGMGLPPGFKMPF